MTYHLRANNAEELEQIRQRPNVTIIDIIVDTEETALTDYWNKNIIPGVSMLVRVKDSEGFNIDNSKCIKDNAGSRMFQDNKGRFGY